MSTEIDTACFKQYGKQFQEKIFQCLLTDKQWASQLSEVMTPDYFDVRYLKYLTGKYFDYHETYKSFPTLSLLITIIRDELREGHDVLLRDQIIEFLHRVKTNPDMGDLQFVKDKTLDFCKKQALKDALEKAVELISTDRYESVIDVIKDALSVGTPSSIGHDFFDDANVRFSKTARSTCPTGIKQLDKKSVLNGGLGRGEIGVIIASTGGGKSHFLVHVGSEALRIGKNVVHYTFELSEACVGLRYDSNLCNIPNNDVIDRKDEILSMYEGMDLGRLIIKSFPTGSATIMTIRNHLEKLLLRSFIPSLIIIDYADIMRSSRKHESLRHELKSIYEEIRNFAMDLNVPVWTASQAHRESANSSIIGLENMSEAYGKAMVSDIVLSLSRKSSEKASGEGRLFVAKNRAGKDGILFPVKLDTSMSKFVIVEGSDELSIDEVMASDNASMKGLLRSKWKEINDK